MKDINPDFVVDFELLNAKAPYLIEKEYSNWKKLNRSILKGSSNGELKFYFLKMLSRLGSLLLRILIDFKHSGNWNEYEYQKKKIKDLSDQLDRNQQNLRITDQKDLQDYPVNLKKSLRSFFLVYGIDLLKMTELQDLMKEERNVSQKHENLKSDDFSRIVDHWLGFLDGNDPRKHVPILKDGEYARIRDYILEFLQDEKIPEYIDPVQRLNTDKGNIRWALKQLYKECFPQREFSKELFSLYTYPICSFQGRQYFQLYETTPSEILR